LAKARTLEGFAYATTERNRQIFTPGHKATYEWIYNSIKELGDYYDVEFHEFTAESANGKLEVDGVTVPADPMTFTPSGNPSGELVEVANIGCDAVWHLLCTVV
jgi:hypothetical protein